MLIGRGAIVREGDRWVATETIKSIEIPDTLQACCWRASTSCRIRPSAACASPR